MKTNISNLYTNNKFSLGKDKQHKRYNNSEHSQLNNKNNTTIRPARAVSFGGSAVSLTEKFVESVPANKLINFVEENEVAYNAIYSLIVAGILKPMAVIAQTGNEDKDGQIIATKNFLQAFIGTFLSLTVGGGFVQKISQNIDNNLKLFSLDKDNNLKVLDETSDSAKEIASKIIKNEHNTIGAKLKNAKEAFSNESGLKKIPAFIATAFKKVDYKPSEKEISKKAQEYVANFNKSHKKILEKNPEYLKELVKNIQDLKHNPISAKNNLKQGQKSVTYDAFGSLWKNSSGAITAIAKAKISSLLLPGVMAFLFAKKNVEANAKKQQEVMSMNNSTLINTKAFKDTEQKFSAFNNSNNAAKIPFTGLTDKALEKSIQGFEWLAMSAGGEKAAKALAKCKKPSARMGDIESFGLTAYWVANTQMSKRIDPDQKLGLNVHTVLVTLLSSAGALIIDKLTDGFVKKSEDTYLKKISDVTSGAVDKLKKGDTIEQIKNEVKNSTSKLYKGNKVAEAIANKEFLELNSAEIKSQLEGLACKYGKQLSKFKSLTIFTLVVRFLVPVFTVNLSKKVKNKLIDWKKSKNEEKRLQNNNLDANKKLTETQKTSEFKNADKK